MWEKLAALRSQSAALKGGRGQHRKYLPYAFTVCLWISLLLCACATPVRRADNIASQAGLARATLLGEKFHHVAYERAAAGGLLLVYLEGDGVPWIHDGREISADPTPREPLALQLAVRSQSASVLYLGRPCYLGLARLPECDSSQWTSGRYSTEVVQSLGACVNRFVAEHAIDRVILVGHSGGGTLAVLMAPHINHVRGVITVAANLDVRAWTAYHGYLPLRGSLDPVDTAPLPATVGEIHLAGGEDTNVPPQLIRGYLSAHPGARARIFARFNHRCCWRDLWPTLLPKLEHDLLENP